MIKILYFNLSTIKAAKKAVEEAFSYELKHYLISAVKVIHNCSIIAAVGESMNNSPGVSGIFFGALGNARINILAISQVGLFFTPAIMH